MFELNPLGNPDALWQHILMLAVAGIIGYIIGYISENQIVNSLETRLQKLDDDLYDCQNRKSKAVVPVVSNTQNFVQTNKTQFDSIINDDLQVIEGVGPQIQSLLQQHGLRTFKQLSDSSPDYLNEILRNAGNKFQMHDPSTWPAQATLAYEKKWDELKTWQDKLNSGRTN